MNLISDIRLRWYDDSSLLQEDPRKLVDLFLESIGVNSDVACDILEVLLTARAREMSLTSREIKERVMALREGRGVDAGSGLTDRNVQIWLKYFRGIKLIERIKSRYLFSKNKKPSIVFSQQTRPIIEESTAFVKRVLEKVEKTYDIE